MAHEHEPAAPPPPTASILHGHAGASQRQGVSSTAGPGQSCCSELRGECVALGVTPGSSCQQQQPGSTSGRRASGVAAAARRSAWAALALLLSLAALLALVAARSGPATTAWPLARMRQLLGRGEQRDLGRDYGGADYGGGEEEGPEHRQAAAQVVASLRRRVQELVQPLPMSDRCVFIFGTGRSGSTVRG